jgi:hypothetical protein
MSDSTRDDSPKPDFVTHTDFFVEFEDHDILPTLDPKQPLPPPIIPRLIVPEDREPRT